MIWRILFLMSFLSIAENAFGVRSRKRDLRARNLHTRQVDSKCIHSASDEKLCPECVECFRQLGEQCSYNNQCDKGKGLKCKYMDGHTVGICTESTGIPCVVYNKTFQHGETFTLDCRTQCACENGTYGCSSLCPQEHISPTGSCQHPRLVDVPGQCCREWMCDSQSAAEQPRSCQPVFSRWSECSSDCGSGLSSRESNLNAGCKTGTEKRICQIRRCLDQYAVMPKHTPQHHLRRGHECKATHRLSTAVHLQFGPCRSRKRYRPKYCGSCPLPGILCMPSLSTTVAVEFLCESPVQESAATLLPELLEPGADLWTDEPPIEGDRVLVAAVQWVLKCRCEEEVLLRRVHRTAQEDGQ